MTRRLHIRFTGQKEFGESESEDMIMLDERRICKKTLVLLYIINPNHRCGIQGETSKPPRKKWFDFESRW